MIFKIEFDGVPVAQVKTPAMVREIVCLAEAGQRVGVSAPSGCQPEYTAGVTAGQRWQQACGVVERAETFLNTAGLCEGTE